MFHAIFYLIPKYSIKQLVAMWRYSIVLKFSFEFAASLPPVMHKHSYTHPNAPVVGPNDFSFKMETFVSSFTGCTLDFTFLRFWLVSFSLSYCCSRLKQSSFWRSYNATLKQIIFEYIPKIKFEHCKWTNYKICSSWRFRGIVKTLLGVKTFLGFNCLCEMIVLMVWMSWDSGGREGSTV